MCSTVPALCRNSAVRVAYELANVLAYGYSMYDMTSSDADAINQVIGNLLLHVIQHAELVLGTTSDRAETVILWPRSIIRSCRVTGNHNLLSSLVIRLVVPVPTELAVAQLEVLSRLVPLITATFAISGQSTSLRMFQMCTLSFAGRVAVAHGLQNRSIDGIVLVLKAQRSIQDSEA